MSDGERITLEQAEKFVAAFFERRLKLSIEAAAAEGIEVVGSIRRRRSDIGDIEIIAPLPRVPEGCRIEASDDRLFRVLNECVRNPHVDGASLFAEAPSTERAFGEAVRGLKPGFKAASLRLEAYGLTVGFDVFRYDALNAGWVKLCRTGPSEFGQWFLGRWKERQGIPVGDPKRQASIDGYLVDSRFQVVPVATEEEAFRLIGANFVQPDRRDAMCDAMNQRRGGA